MEGFRSKEYKLVEAETHKKKHKSLDELVKECKYLTREEIA
jgi:hypothetical protein